MSERTTTHDAASVRSRLYTNGATPQPAEPEPAADPKPRGVSSMLVPLVLIATALIVLRRVQRGDYA